MNVHIIKSEEVDPRFFLEVGQLLESIKGPIKFTMDHDARQQFSVLLEKEDDFIEEIQLPIAKSEVMMDEMMAEAHYVRWDDIFGQCHLYRQNNDIGDNEFVVLVTDVSNELNWFVGGDEQSKNNFFVHSGGWNMFMDCEKKFPVAYHIAYAALTLQMFDTYKDVEKHIHLKPIGCMMDFCLEKKDVHFKLRTGDICPDCLNLLYVRKVDKAKIKQVFDVFESIRSQMVYMRRFEFTQKPSQILLKGKWNTKVFLTDLNHQEIHLTPLEKTIWFLWLNHPDGIHYNELPSYRAELMEIYSKLSGDATLAEMNNKIDRLCNLVDNSSLREKVSRLNRKFKQAVGEEMALFYQIKGEHGSAKAVKLARTMVVRE